MPVLKPERRDPVRGLGMSVTHSNTFLKQQYILSTFCPLTEINLKQLEKEKRKNIIELEGKSTVSNSQYSNRSI